MQTLLPKLLKMYGIVREIAQKTRKSAISAYSGQSAFMLILSFFPFLMFLLALLNYTPLTRETLFSTLEMIFPASFHEFISPILSEIFQSHTTTLLPITVITALWLASKAFVSLIYGLNSVYEIEETRNYFILRIWSVIYTLFFAIILLATLTVLVFGNTLFFYLTKHFPIIERILLPIISFRSLGGFLIMLLFFTFLYKNIPNHPRHGTKKRLKKSKKSSFIEQLPGALLATTGWMGFSFLYSYYVDHISNYASFYGTMTTIALLMIWLYACMYILFLGGLINFLLQRDHILHNSASGIR